MTWFFWLHMITYDYFSSVFCIVPKKVLLLKYRIWVSHLKNRYHYEKVVENARINFSISPYCTLLFSRKENFNFLEVALSAVLCNCPVGNIMNMWGYQHWNTTNTTLDIYLLFENGHKSTQTRCKACSKLTKCTTTIEFRLASVFFINLEHRSHPTLVLLFMLWKSKCWLKAPQDFCQNNTVMLTYSRVSNRLDSPLINYSVFCHPPQPYSALPIY